MGYWLRYFSGLEVPREVIQDDEAVYAEVVRRPVGVVAAITPWNFPIVLAGWKLGPALLAGNTVVLKPSPYTPRSTLLVGEILNEVLPPGVAQRRVRRRRARPVDDLTSHAPQDQLHGLGGHGQARGRERRARPQAGDARARRQRPGDPPRRRRPRRHRREAVPGCLRQLRADLLGHQAGVRARGAPRRRRRRARNPCRRGQGRRRHGPGHRARPDPEQAAVRAGERAGRRGAGRAAARPRRAVRRSTGPATSSSRPCSPASRKACGSWTRSSSVPRCR